MEMAPIAIARVAAVMAATMAMPSVVLLAVHVALPGIVETAAAAPVMATMSWARWCRRLASTLSSFSCL